MITTRRLRYITQRICVRKMEYIRYGAAEWMNEKSERNFRNTVYKIHGKRRNVKATKDIKNMAMGRSGKRLRRRK